MGSSRLSQFLFATSDPDAATVLAPGVSAYRVYVQPDICLSGYPAGCTTAGSPPPPPYVGVNRMRGAPWGASGGFQTTCCGVPHSVDFGGIRFNAAFLGELLLQVELRSAQGSSWSEYSNSLDLAYGIAKWDLAELSKDDGSGRWDINGFYYERSLDSDNACTGAGEDPTQAPQPVAQETVAMTFLPLWLVDGDNTSWINKFKIYMQKAMVAYGTTAVDCAGLAYSIQTTAASVNPLWTAAGSGTMGPMLARFK